MENMDYNFLIGDFGFSSGLQSFEVLQAINSYEAAKKSGDVAKADKYFSLLLKNDELTTSKTELDYLSKYTEAKIKFLPTYKYEKYNAVYAQSATPAW